MATANNPRKKSKTPDKEETEVTDTATTATDAAPAAEPAAAPEAAKPTIDHEGNLYKAIVAFVADGNVENLQTAYRAVPAAARGKVQGTAMKRALNDGVGLDKLGDVLDAFSNLPTAVKPSRTKVELEPDFEGAIRLVAFMNAFDAVKTEVGENSIKLAEGWYGTDSVPGEYKSYVESTTASLAKASAVKNASARGPRTTFKESFKDLVTRGDIPVGAELKGSGDITATVTDDGKIKTSQGEFDAPSAAAKIHTTKDGKDTATNGWAFWTYNGKAIGEYRKA